MFEKFIGKKICVWLGDIKFAGKLDTDSHGHFFLERTNDRIFINTKMVLAWSIEDD